MNYLSIRVHHAMRISSANVVLQKIVDDILID